MANNSSSKNHTDIKAAQDELGLDQISPLEYRPFSENPPICKATLKEINMPPIKAATDSSLSPESNNRGLCSSTPCNFKTEKNHSTNFFGSKANHKRDVILAEKNDLPCTLSNIDNDESSDISLLSEDPDPNRFWCSADRYDKLNIDLLLGANAISRPDNLLKDKDLGSILEDGKVGCKGIFTYDGNSNDNIRTSICLAPQKYTNDCGSISSDSAHNRSVDLLNVKKPPYPGISIIDASKRGVSLSLEDDDHEALNENRDCGGDEDNDISLPSQIINVFTPTLTIKHGAKFFTNLLSVESAKNRSDRLISNDNGSLKPRSNLEKAPDEDDGDDDGYSFISLVGDFVEGYSFGIANEQELGPNSKKQPMSSLKGEVAPTSRFEHNPLAKQRKLRCQRLWDKANFKIKHRPRGPLSPPLVNKRALSKLDLSNPFLERSDVAGSAVLVEQSSAQAAWNRHHPNQAEADRKLAAAVGIQLPKRILEEYPALDLPPPPQTKKFRPPPRCTRIIDSSWKFLAFSQFVEDDFYANRLAVCSATQGIAFVEYDHRHIYGCRIELWWEDETGKLLIDKHEFVPSVRALCWSPDGGLMALGHEIGEVQIWDVKYSDWVRTLTFDDPSPIVCIAWFENIIAIGMHNGKIFLHDFTGPACTSTQLTSHPGRVLNIAWRNDGKQLASASCDGTVYVFRAGETVPYRVLKRHKGPVKALAWCPWDDNLLATGEFEGNHTLRLWNIYRKEVECSAETGEPIILLSFVASHRELLLVHGSLKDNISIWTASDLRPVARTSALARPAYTAFSDQNYLYMIGVGGYVERNRHLFTTRSPYNPPLPPEDIDPTQQPFPSNMFWGDGNML